MALQNTVEDLRTEMTTNANALKAAQDRLVQRESEAGELESEVLRLKAQTGDVETLTVIKRELSEQVLHIRKLESTNREQNTELKHFRKIHKATEVVEEEKRALQSRLGLLDDTQKRLREAQLQKQILEDEKRSWTSYLQSQGGDEFDTPEEIARALVRQRVENANLVEQVGAQKSEMIERDEIIKQLEEEKARLSSDLDKAKGSKVAGFAPPISNATGPEHRTKQRLENQLNFAKREVGLMREQLRSFDAEEEQVYAEENKYDLAKSKRIQDLEVLMDDQRKEITDLTSEVAVLEGKVVTAEAMTLAANNQKRLAHANSPLKRPLDISDENTIPQASSLQDNVNENELIGRLTRKNRNLQSQLSALQSAHTVLETEHNAQNTQLSSLRETAKIRVLCLRNNPTDDFEALKLETIRALRAENRDLLSALQNRSSSALAATGKQQQQPLSNSSSGATSAPFTTLTSLRLEISEKDSLVAEKEKRMLRLKQIWGRKALEMREAVFSLLGWVMEFRPDGKFALTILPPESAGDGDGSGGRGDNGDDDGDDDGDESPKEEETLIFDGERGTMKVSGGTGSSFARKVRPSYKEWVEGRGNIPGFMASLVLGRLMGEI